ncbi:bcl-2-interacting killer isoform X2 [Rousettus aegyptiacus]|nr:bcl-2-interacting killer isoform X2 [Rousettus aegyptiacus]XP_036093502.1 bcl-2-interacting killer isoform X2 [Rousettus aegyptiacus]
MSLSRNLILCTFLQEHGLQAQSPPGMTSLLQHHNPHPHGDIPHEMAMRLAFIGDEMEGRWMLPRFAELPWMAVYSLAFTYQTGLRGVLRSLMDGLTHLRGNRRFWSFLTLRDRVSWDSLGLWSSHSVGQTPSGGQSLPLPVVLPASLISTAWSQRPLGLRLLRRRLGARLPGCLARFPPVRRRLPRRAAASPGRHACPVSAGCRARVPFLTHLPRAGALASLALPRRVPRAVSLSRHPRPPRPRPLRS